MARNDLAGDTVTSRLQEAIDRLQEDVRRVEIWAGALSGFLQPVPDYDDTEHRHALTRPEHRLNSNDNSQHGLSAPPRFAAPFRDA